MLECQGHPKTVITASPQVVICLFAADHRPVEEGRLPGHARVWKLQAPPTGTSGWRTGDPAGSVPDATVHPHGAWGQPGEPAWPAALLASCTMPPKGSKSTQPGQYYMVTKINRQVSFQIWLLSKWVVRICWFGKERITRVKYTSCFRSPVNGEPLGINWTNGFPCGKIASNLTKKKKK